MQHPKYLPPNEAKSCHYCVPVAPRLTSICSTFDYLGNVFRPHVLCKRFSCIEVGPMTKVLLLPVYPSVRPEALNKSGHKSHICSDRQTKWDLRPCITEAHDRPISIPPATDSKSMPERFLIAHGSFAIGSTRPYQAIDLCQYIVLLRALTISFQF